MTQVRLWEPTLDERIADARAYYQIGVSESDDRSITTDTGAEFDVLIEDIRADAKDDMVDVDSEFIHRKDARIAELEGRAFTDEQVLAAAKAIDQDLFDGEHSPIMQSFVDRQKVEVLAWARAILEAARNA